ncbi:hypothetical protein O3P69_008167 [Scylla paramamosain]|uniref:Major facilitator superfamily (MFS) profile domain-containing protein n=2 Tax=Scylla paramamosain TaxID=85552 RepID=A0AAW0T446_SCYPA
MGCVPARLVLALMCLLGFINLYMVRVNLSVIIVAMVRRNTSLEGHRAPCLSYLPTNGSLDDGKAGAAGIEDMDQEGELEWSESVQGFVLGSFFYGYAITQIVGGRAAEVYGVRWVFGSCILAGGVSALLSPIAARTHYGLLITVRFLQGMCQGVSWPSMHALIVLWIPPLERPRFIGFVYFVTAMSAWLTFVVCGFIIAAWGWAVAFYVTGLLSILWCFLWFAFMYNSPAEHPRISKAELEHIETTVQESGFFCGGDGAGQKQHYHRPQRVPWKQMFCSLPVWAILVHGMGNTWGISIYYSQLPTYMKNILGFSIKSNGVVSGLPFLTRYLGAITWSSLGDALTSRNYISVLTCRRVASMIGMWGPAVMLVCVAYIGCHWQAVVIFMCIALFCNGAISSSAMVNHTDIAPNFAATVFGVDNTMASVVSSIGPVVVGVMTDGQQMVAQWQKVFWTCVPIYFFTEVFYLAFASATVQPWNYIGQILPYKEENQDEEEQRQIQHL